MSSWTHGAAAEMLENGSGLAARSAVISRQLWKCAGGMHLMSFGPVRSVRLAAAAGGEVLDSAAFP